MWHDFTRISAQRPGLTPDSAVRLEWDTFSDAADEAGISRLYGGIHFEQGDLNGRLLGARVGTMVHNRAQYFINGGKKDLELVENCNQLPNRRGINSLTRSARRGFLKLQARS